MKLKESEIKILACFVAKIGNLNIKDLQKDHRKRDFLIDFKLISHTMKFVFQ